MDNKTEVMELPLFPLKTVLFPGQVLQLHIFEERYLLMIRRCLADDSPFGVLLIRKGNEVGETAETYAVGTVAQIRESSHLPDGTMNVITVGTERFQVRRYLYDRPYLRGEVESYPLLMGEDDPSTERLAREVRQAVGLYVKLIAEAAGLNIQIDDIPAAPLRLGYLAAVAMQIDNDEKQELLSSPSLLEIMRAEKNLLKRENTLLDWIAANREYPHTRQFGPSGMLLPN